ncbi:prolyl-tRNA synthetase associated domain-containing protein [Candidatus Peribacteria bacterium]|nr:prolyl-tRNA synthetase associated domain-containing protein [Candidatus Peribacteria bacterium]
MDDLLQLLSTLGISYSRYDHPAVFSCAESEKLCPKMEGAHTKQLLMKAKGKEIYVLAIVMHDKRVDTKTLAKDFGAQSFSFVSPEKLKEMLGVTPGSVTPFGLSFDTEKKINVIVDEDAWSVGKFCFHPLVNTATLEIDHAGFESFLKHTRHGFTIRKIPV